jgi:hypothetical protein
MFFDLMKVLNRMDWYLIVHSALTIFGTLFAAGVVFALLKVQSAVIADRRVSRQCQRNAAFLLSENDKSIKPHLFEILMSSKRQILDVDDDYAFLRMGGHLNIEEFRGKSFRMTIVRNDQMRFLLVKTSNEQLLVYDYPDRSKLMTLCAHETDLTRFEAAQLVGRFRL